MRIFFYFIVSIFIFASNPANAVFFSFMRNIPTTAEDGGMGGVNTGIEGRLSSLYYNPAALNFKKNILIGVTQTYSQKVNYFADIRFKQYNKPTFAGINLSLKRFSIGLGYYLWQYNLVAAELDSGIGESKHVVEYLENSNISVIFLPISIQIIKNINLALNIEQYKNKRIIEIKEDISDYYAKTKRKIKINPSLFFKFNSLLGESALGISYKDKVFLYDEDFLRTNFPQIFRIGISNKFYTNEVLNILIAFDYSRERWYLTSYSVPLTISQKRTISNYNFGIEANIKNQYFIRTGFYTTKSPTGDPDPNVFEGIKLSQNFLTFGLGLKLKYLELNASYEQTLQPVTNKRKIFRVGLQYFFISIFNK